MYFYSLSFTMMSTIQNDSCDYFLSLLMPNTFIIELLRLSSLMFDSAQVLELTSCPSPVDGFGRCERSFFPNSLRLFF